MFCKLEKQLAYYIIIVMLETIIIEFVFAVFVQAINIDVKLYF